MCAERAGSEADNQTQTALLSIGDDLSRLLAQQLPATLEQQGRVVLLGRSLATNLLGALPATIEQVSRRQGQPLQTEWLEQEGHLLLLVVNVDGEIVRRLPAHDLLNDLLFQRGRLPPQVLSKLTEALSGDEHHATRQLVDLLRSRPVLEALQKLLLNILKSG